MMPKDFDKAIQDDGVVLVDFYSRNCGPCRMLNPILDELENVKVLKVNVAAAIELASQHEVSAVPTLKFFKGGKLQETLVGLQSKDVLQSKIDALNEA